jgi:hypothetical protein
MGCDGRELWPGPAAIAAGFVAKLAVETGQPAGPFRARVNRAIGNQPLSVLYTERRRLTKEITQGRPRASPAVAVGVRTENCNRKARHGVATHHERS